MAYVQSVKDGQLVDTTASATSDSTAKTKGGNTLGQQDFLELLVAEMQYQDPLEPQSNTDYIAQLATFTQVQDIEEMQSVVENMRGSNLIGKYVILNVTSKATGNTNVVAGYVDYVTYENGNTYLSVNNGLYSLDDLDTVTTKDYQEMAVLVTEFSQMIADLPDAENVTLVNEEAIKEARTLYDSMTKDQKGYVDPADVKKLEAAEERIKEIKGSTD